MDTAKYKRYSDKCAFFCIRFRKDKEKKYIDFLKSCPNKTEFIRKAIDAELGTH